MIEETAFVESSYDEKKNGDSYIVVTILKKTSACGHCSGNSGCGTSILSQIFKIKEQKLHLKNTIHAEKGDQIIIAIEDSDFLKASMNVYILPLISIIFFAMIAAILANIYQFSDAWRDLFVITFAITGLYFSRHIKTSYTHPQPVRIIKKIPKIQTHPLLYAKT
jgi:sigma-E factor negative regulatory protein RseC